MTVLLRSHDCTTHNWHVRSETATLIERIIACRIFERTASASYSALNIGAFENVGGKRKLAVLKKLPMRFFILHAKRIACLDYYGLRYQRFMYCVLQKTVLATFE